MTKKAPKWHWTKEHHVDPKLIFPLAYVQYDANMALAAMLGLGLSAQATLPAQLADVRTRAKLVDEIDGPMVWNFGLPIDQIAYHLGRHVDVLSTRLDRFFPRSTGPLWRVGVTLRLWAGCISGAKTIAFKTAAGVNTTEARTMCNGWLEQGCQQDPVYAAGVETAPVFKRRRGQRVYFDGIAEGSVVRRHEKEIKTP
jgi:hypothetical protein